MRNRRTRALRLELQAPQATILCSWQANAWRLWSADTGAHLRQSSAQIDDEQSPRRRTDTYVRAREMMGLPRRFHPTLKSEVATGSARRTKPKCSCRRRCCRAAATKCIHTKRAMPFGRRRSDASGPGRSPVLEQRSARLRFQGRRLWGWGARQGRPMRHVVHSRHREAAFCLMRHPCARRCHDSR